MVLINIIVWNKYSWIKAPQSVLDSISEYLSYPVKNSHYTTSGKEKVSLLTFKNAFKTGFLKGVMKIVVDSGYEFTIEDKRNNRFVVEEVITELPTGTLRDYQKDSVKAIFPNTRMVWYRGVVNAATNAGKNWIIGCVVKTVQPHSKVMITVHRVELFKQLYEFLTECGIKVSRYGNYKNKAYKELGDVTLCMYTTMAPNITNADVQLFLPTVGTVIVDECHRATAKNYYEVLKAADASCVVYLSGTPFNGEPAHDLNIIGDSGEQLVTITNQDLIEQGVSLKPTVQMYWLNEYDSASSYDDEKFNIIMSQQRLDIIRNEILGDLNKVVLISVLTKEHGQHLLNQLIGLPTTVDFIYSDDPDRTEKLEDYRKGIIKVLITTEVLKEGINIPLVNTLINAAWGKSIVWVKQFVGRLLRDDGINTTCTIVDFVDVGHNTKDQSLVRYALYQAEGFEIINNKYGN